jgi:hypothetical protein
MKSFFLALFVVVCPLTMFGQSSNKKPPLPAHPNGPASEEVQTETIGPTGQTHATPANPTGYLEPAQLKVLTHKIWLAQYRLTDLLSQVHPEKWKIPPATKQSFAQSLDSLQKAMAAEEDWRGQLDVRPDSLYLGFQMFMAISAVLPRVDGVAHSVSQYENPSFGGQFTQAGNQLFDLQQTIEPHLAYLLKNQDSLFLAAQTNLASCQNELNFAEHNKEGDATPMKNIAPDFKGRKRTAHAAAPGDGVNPSAARDKTAAKPAAKSTHKTKKQTHPQPKADN